MFHDRLSLHKRYPDNVKPGLPVVQPVPAEKKKRCLDHLSLLAPIDRLERGAKAPIRTGFYLDEDYHSTVQNNQIQFSNRTAVIPLNNPVTLFPEISLRNPFPFLT